MDQDEFKGQDMLRDITDGLGDFGRKVSDKVSQMMDDFGSDAEPKGSLGIRADIFKTQTHYVIELELPGVDKKKVRINAVDNILAVKGTKAKSKDATDAIVVKSECKHGEFSRSFELPEEEIEMENIKASFSDGLLTIKFPLKKKQPKKKADDDISSIDIE